MALGQDRGSYDIRDENPCEEVRTRDETERVARASSSPATVRLGDLDAPPCWSAANDTRTTPVVDSPLSLPIDQPSFLGRGVRVAAQTLIPSFGDQPCCKAFLQQGTTTRSTTKIVAERHEIGG